MSSRRARIASRLPMHADLPRPADGSSMRGTAGRPSHGAHTEPVDSHTHAVGYSDDTARCSYAPSATSPSGTFLADQPYLCGTAPPPLWWAPAHPVQTCGCRRRGGCRCMRNSGAGCTSVTSRPPAHLADAKISLAAAAHVLCVDT